MRALRQAPPKVAQSVKTGMELECRAAGWRDGRKCGFAQALQGYRSRTQPCWRDLEEQTLLGNDQPVTEESQVQSDVFQRQRTAYDK